MRSSPVKEAALQRKAFWIGLTSSLFFSLTFLLNRSMSLSGGHFLWTSALRYLFLFPLLYLTVRLGGQDRIQQAHAVLRAHPRPWLIWSIVGFWVFYFFLCLGSGFGPSWLVAAVWQLTLVFGVLLTPLFGQAIPRRSLACACFILLGVALIQVQAAHHLAVSSTLLCVLSVALAALAYPLGNRKLMALNHGLSTLQRIYLMTLCTMPLWIIQALGAWIYLGPPSASVVLQGFAVALGSGLIATLLFFYATDLSRHCPKALAITESTIAGEILFTVIGGILFLQDPLPAPLSWVGLILIIVSMAFNR